MKKFKLKFKNIKKRPETNILPGDIPGTVKIWHTQDIKQSQNYQTVGASYGIQMTVKDNPKDITRGILQAESVVEKFLTSKYKEQRNLLEKIS